jgi:hypothetical protein
MIEEEKKTRKILQKFFDAKPCKKIVTDFSKKTLFLDENEVGYQQKYISQKVNII